MSEHIFSEQDLARMNEMLTADSEPLSDLGQLAISGANCVLAGFEGQSVIETPGMFLLDVALCIRQHKGAVTSTFKIIQRAGLVERQQPDPMVARLYGSAIPPVFYVPRPNSEGQHFFKPQRRPGCELTLQDNIIASLSPPSKKLLTGLSQMALTGQSIRAADLEYQMGREPLKNALRRFELAGVLVRDVDQYQLTERGLWLMSGLKSAPKTDAPTLYHPPFSAPTPKSVVKPETGEPKAILKPSAEDEKETEKPTVVEQWLIEVIDKHPTESHHLIKEVSRLIRDGVLKFTEVRPSSSNIWVYSSEKDRWLGFSGYAMKHTTAEQRNAILFWAKIDILFYGRHLIPKNVEMELGLRKDSYLETYVPRSIYRPLVATIAAEKAAKKQNEV